MEQDTTIPPSAFSVQAHVEPHDNPWSLPLPTVRNKEAHSGSMLCPAQIACSEPYLGTSCIKSVRGDVLPRLSTSSLDGPTSAVLVQV